MAASDHEPRPTTVTRLKKNLDRFPPTTLQGGAQVRAGQRLRARPITAAQIAAVASAPMPLLRLSRVPFKQKRLR